MALIEDAKTKTKTAREGYDQTIDIHRHRQTDTHDEQTIKQRDTHTDRQTNKQTHHSFAVPQTCTLDDCHVDTWTWLVLAVETSALACVVLKTYRSHTDRKLFVTSKIDV